MSGKPKLSFYEKVTLPFIILRLRMFLHKFPKKALLIELGSTLVLLIKIALVILYNSLFARNSVRNKNKTKPRILFDSSARFILGSTTAAQLQAISVPSYDSYLKWVKDVNEEPIVNDLSNGARLFWLGPRKSSKVVIYCHGGGFVGPLSDFECRYWRRLQNELSDNSKRFDVAMLEYSLWPIKFPTQLKQLISAIECVLETGVHPSNIYLSGDSSGGNLIMQLISHILHPLKDVPKLSITFDEATTKFGGAILYSPYTALTGRTGSHITNDTFDLVPAFCLGTWGKLYLDPIPEDQRLYAHANIAPERFFEGVEKFIKRFMITSGEKECLRDDIILFSDILKKSHGDVTLIVEKDAVHADPIFAFAVKTKELFGSRRHIRIKKADDTVESGTDPSEKEYRNVNGRCRSGPSEAHSVDKKGREGSLDPQSQGAQGSMRGPKSESPSYIYGQVYKEGKEGVGGTERGGQTDAAPPGSWWESMKHKLGFKGE
ncbi:hypothetical protein Clacol_001987 [Clathrus columnatus]|uniref:Alpha/beta hydrolase fold-3 domain-containing protein n=1 Tax=Clathrus columnatus TaxID=1419009 RepID=A0AAV5A2V9_9AGAM|nr:hypothetical protein Clacol_001987 [Clathrus columnatus]